MKLKHLTIQNDRTIQGEKGRVYKPEIIEVRTIMTHFRELKKSDIICDLELRIVTLELQKSSLSRIELINAYILGQEGFVSHIHFHPVVFCHI